MYVQYMKILNYQPSLLLLPYNSYITKHKPTTPKCEFQIASILNANESLWHKKQPNTKRNKKSPTNSFTLYKYVCMCVHKCKNRQVCGERAEIASNRTHTPFQSKEKNQVLHMCYQLSAENRAAVYMAYAQLWKAPKTSYSFQCKYVHVCGGAEWRQIELKISTYILWNVSLVSHIWCVW